MLHTKTPGEITQLLRSPNLRLRVSTGVLETVDFVFGIGAGGVSPEVIYADIHNLRDLRGDREYPNWAISARTVGNTHPYCSQKAG